MDFSKTFDSLQQSFLLDALESHGLPTLSTNITKETYTNLKVRIIIDKTGKYSNLEVGEVEVNTQRSIISNTF